MSWIRTTTGDAVNLDYIASIGVAEKAEPDGGADVDDSTHGIFLNDAEGDSFLIFEGDEDYCKAKMEQIVAKLPMVKP